MKVIGFVGPSGTGKSYKSTWVSKDKKVEYIIDDGLLIKGNRIIAGKSAKAAPTKVGSVKCALFQEEEHRDEVIAAIKKEKINSIMIIGTSDGMVEKIAERLALHGIDEKVYIWDVATEEEIEKAKQTRIVEGKHIIPVPTFEVKRSFSGFFLNPISLFRRRGKENLEVEKTVVRPTFSYMGSFKISDNVFRQIAEHLIFETEQLAKSAKVEVHKMLDGMTLSIEIVTKSDVWTEEKIKSVSDKIVEETENITAFNIKDVSIEVRSKVKQQKGNV